MEQRLWREGAAWESVAGADTVELDGTRARLVSGDITVEVTALAPDLIRVGMFPAGQPPNYMSEALAGAEWPHLEAAWNQGQGEIALTTAAATVRVSLDPIRVSFADPAGRPFACDDRDLGMRVGPAPAPDEFVGRMVGAPVGVCKRREPGERLFGCGERSSGLDKTHGRLTFWNVDPPIGHTPAHDNLYTSIPFVLALHEGRAWGLFYDYPGRVEFDLGHADPHLLQFGAAGGALVYYLFAGPTVGEVLETYTALTGRTPMPPLWALGNQQSRHSYQTAEDFEGVAREFRARGIPCDTLYLDIYYMDGFRVFTWDREHFPDPPGMIERLRQQGFHVVTIIDPGVKVDDAYAIYREGREGRHFCRTYRGEEYHNVVWPGVCAFPDFTSTATRRWWGDHCRDLLGDGIAGIWCDMDEPSLFVPLQSTMPEDVVHPGDGEPRLHAQVHNLYGLGMARAVREGLERLQPDHRPVVITRSGYAGVQRYALQWMGDNSAWWEHLAMAMPQLQNMGLSGVAWCGVDIGGFFGDTTGELLARWTEMGILQPFCRNHSDIGSRRQEPWLFGPEVEQVIRSMLLLRQRLLPYFYTLFDECNRTGAPVLRPMLWEFAADEQAVVRDDQMMLGSALLAAPVTHPRTEHRHVYLPEGTWFHWWTGERVDGPAHVLAHAPLGHPALYLRANTALPLWPEMQFVGERRPDPLTLVLYPAEGSGEADLYEDAGDGYGYRRGEFARRRIDCALRDGRIHVRISPREGSYEPDRERVVLELRSVQRPERVQVDGQSGTWRHDEAAQVLSVDLPETAGAIEVEVQPASRA